MIFIILLIGVILVAASYKGTQAQLFSELKVDIPQFGLWAAAIVALGVIGFIPGLKPISRGLLGLVLLVIILNNYSKIIPGFEKTFSSLGGPSSNGSGNTATSTSVQSGLDAINVLNPSYSNSGISSVPNLTDSIAGSVSSYFPTAGIGAGN